MSSYENLSKAPISQDHTYRIISLRASKYRDYEGMTRERRKLGWDTITAIFEICLVDVISSVIRSLCLHCGIQKKFRIYLTKERR